MQASASIASEENLESLSLRLDGLEVGEVPPKEKPPAIPPATPKTPLMAPAASAQLEAAEERPRAALGASFRDLSLGQRSETTERWKGVTGSNAGCGCVDKWFLLARSRTLSTLAWLFFLVSHTHSRDLLSLLTPQC